MADLRLRVGNVTALITLGGTDAQIAAALTRYATSLGIAITGTPTENLTAVLEHVRDDIKRRSKAAQRQELLAAQMAEIDSTVDEENPL